MAFRYARNPRGGQRAAVSALALALSLGAFATNALAQDTEDDAASDKSEIVVTGSLIRGVAPGGANVVTVTKDSIQASGVTTTAQLLATIPQLGTFGDRFTPLGIGGINVNRPNLRSLPGFNTGGGSTTLVLLDGHRVVGMGNTSTTPDPDFIPPGAIERTEIVPDGGSAIYGSDAVAGVMNFITRRDFDGIEVNARYGFADDYYTFSANGTIGKKWDGGSIFLSYAFAKNDDLLGRDRDFSRRFVGPSGLPATFNNVATNNPQSTLALTCSPGNVLANGIVYALPFTTATAAGSAARVNQCDTSDYATLVGADRRHSIMAGLQQDLSPDLSISVRANYFNRQNSTINGPFTSNQTVPLGAMGFADHRVGAETSQTVYFQYGSPDASRSSFELETWGVNGELTYRPGGDWRVRLLGNYGESRATELARSVNGTALTRAINGGLFNAYDWQTSTPAALAALFNYGTQNDARQRLVNFRVVGDGTLFSLPGGNVKLAVGAEYIGEFFKAQNGTGIPGQILSGSPAVSVNGVLLLDAIAPTVNKFDLSRNVKALFGELSIPLFGADNATTLFRELTLSVSGRYDHYSGGVGGTFNPKIGVNWTPVEGVRLRGAWGKSFNAPSLADLEGAALTTAAVGGQLGNLIATDSGRPPQSLITAGLIPNFAPKQAVLSISGNSPGIKPQTGTTLSLGVDIDPAFVPGLHLGLTYWSIRMKNLIQRAPTTDQIQWWVNNRTNPGKFIYNPSATDILNALGSLDQPLQQSLCPGPNPLTTSTNVNDQIAANCVYVIVDARKTNFGSVNVAGLDFDVSYRHDTSFGSIDASWRGTLEVKREQQVGVGAPFISQLGYNNNVFRFTASVGADIGNLRAQVTWNHRHGYDLNPIVTIPGTTNTQTRIGDFNVFNLFMKYDVNGERMFKDLSFTLNLDNIFNTDPPVAYGSQFLGAQTGYANGFTVGRMLSVGVSKRF